MRSQVSVSLNGVALTDVDERILLQRVDEAAPSVSQNTVGLANGIGQIVTSTERQYMDISIGFAIGIPRDLTRRAEILDKVTAWAANGGLLEVSYRPGKQLRVMMVQQLAVGYIREWTEEYTLVLRAFIPFWEDVTPHVVPSNRFKDHVIEIKKITWTAETPLDVSALSIADPGNVMTMVRITIGTQVLEYSGFEMLTGDTLRIWHNDAGLLMADITHAADGSIESIYGLRTAASADDLLLPVAPCGVRVESDRLCNWTLSIRGRYL